MKLTAQDKLFHTALYALLTLLGFLTLYPFWNSVVLSFNSGYDTSLGGVTFWPRDFTLDNYRIVFSDARLGDSFLISLLRTVAGTFFSILLTMMLGYGLSRRGVVGHKAYMLFFLITMFFQGGLIPSFLINRSLGLMDSFWVLVVPFLINVWNMIIFRTFFRELPEALEESAKIDGCNQFGILFRIIVPVSGPVIATLSLFTAIFHWNDWFTASIYINNQTLMPVQSLLQQILNSNLSSELLLQATGGNASAMEVFDKAQTITTKSLSMAIMIVTTLPIILLYPFLQRYFVKGVMVGSLKG
ncbi:carbohydrate ABC transporter permease [Paenibacillus sp. GCM10023252]|uniref:carbohydrate ABC transporter permease n=1 Tax=Paenibacillus sp. GCM10023252 TaxID=3252649 RepID=UPI003607DB26